MACVEIGRYDTSETASPVARFLELQKMIERRLAFIRNTNKHVNANKMSDIPWNKLPDGSSAYVYDI
jgi:hypothetical protein